MSTVALGELITELGLTVLSSLGTLRKILATPANESSSQRAIDLKESAIAEAIVAVIRLSLQSPQVPPAETEPTLAESAAAAAPVPADLLSGIPALHNLVLTVGELSPVFSWIEAFNGVGPLLTEQMTRSDAPLPPFNSKVWQMLLVAWQQAVLLTLNAQQMSLGNGGRPLTELRLIEPAYYKVRKAVNFFFNHF